MPPTQVDAAALPAAPRYRNNRGSRARIAVQFIVGSFVSLVGAIAILSGAGWVNLPYELFLLDQRLPAVFRIHMAASGLALVLITIALLVRHWPVWHRLIGRLAAIAVVIGGFTALPSAMMSEATAIARAGFFAQGCVWLSLLGTGLAAIRARQVVRHQRMMLAMAAVASGAIWVRCATVAIAAFDLPFDLVYASAAWAGWLVPFAAVWLVQGAKQRTRPSQSRQTTI